VATGPNFEPVEPYDPHYKTRSLDPHHAARPLIRVWLGHDPGSVGALTLSMVTWDGAEDKVATMCQYPTYPRVA
jgi:hypothetical protein